MTAESADDGRFGVCAHNVNFKIVSNLLKPDVVRIGTDDIQITKRRVI